MRLRRMVPALVMLAQLAVPPPPCHAEAAQDAVAPEDLHPITYPDGQTTTNDRCAVRKRKLNSKIAPVWVNQKPVGFC